MKFKISTVYTAILYIMLASQMLILTGLPFRIYIIVSIGTWGIMLCQMASLLMLFADGKKKLIDNNRLMILAILIALSLFAVVLSTSIDLNVLIKLLTFTQLPTFLFIATRNNKRRLKDAVYGVNFIYPILFLVLYRMPFAHRIVGEYGDGVHNDITLGYNNPNEAAIYMMFCFFIILSAMYRYKNIWIRALALIEACVLSYLMYLTNCRAAVIICLVVVIYMMFTTEITIQPLLLGAVFLIPVIYTISIISFPSLASIELMGETIENGRREIIIAFIEELNVFEFMFGNFGKYQLSNMHNAMISVIASVGIIVFGVYFTSIYFGYKRILRSAWGKRDFMPLALGMLGIIIHSTAEAAPLVAGSVYAASMFMLAYLTVPDKEINGSEEIENITH